MRYLIYAFFALIPFLRGTVAGHVYLPEIPLALIALMTPLFRKKGVHQEVGFLDVAVFIYAGFTLISVIVGMESLYVSARYYRTMVLSPVVAYLVLRYSSASGETLRNGLLWMMPGLVVQAFFFLRYYIQYGKRPLNVEGVVTSSITVGILMCIAAIAAFYFQRGLKKKFLARGLTLAGCFFVAGLFISGGRMVVASFIVLGTLAPFVCRSERLWRLQSIAVPGVMVVVLLAVLVGVVGGPKLRFDTDRSKDRTVERLYNIDQYEKDLRVRFVYWSAIAKEALKNPILGSGADRYEIGKVANTGFKLGSSHNALISALVVSGIPGVFLVFAFVFGCYRFLRSVLGQRNTIRAVGMTLWVGVTCMVFVALTNDLSAGRMFFWFTLMGMSGRYASICALECGVLKGTPVATTILEKPAG